MDTDAPTGGDFYDWLHLPDGTVHITIVDALGHGVRSTRSALNVTHAVRTLALEGHPLESIVARTHDILVPFDPEIMATVLLARIHPGTGELRLANGSHPPALLLRADGTSDYLETRGRGIGFPLPGSESVLEETLHEGDLLVLYTDGLTESRRDPIEGEARLVKSARAHAQRPVDEIPGAVAEDMHTVILHSDDTLALAVHAAPARRPGGEGGGGRVNCPPAPPPLRATGRRGQAACGILRGPGSADPGAAKCPVPRRFRWVDASRTPDDASCTPAERGVRPTGVKRAYAPTTCD